MAYKRFRISTRNSGRLRTIWVWAYDTVQEMRAAGVAHAAKINSGETGFDKAYGLSQLLEYVHLNSSGRATRRYPDAGHIRLCRIGLRMGVITHEATHMAIAIYQQDVQKTIPDMEREEILCYLVGDISSKIVKKLYKLQLLP